MVGHLQHAAPVSAKEQSLSNKGILTLSFTFACYQDVLKH